jgi:hypothetical protein
VSPGRIREEWLGSFVLQFQDDFEDFRGERACVHAVHVGEHCHTGALFWDYREGSACALLGAGVGQDVNTNLIDYAPAET